MKYVNNGIAVRKMTPKRNAHTAAVAWCEGRETLRELLEFCINNKIYTLGCCAGHEENHGGAYVSFPIRNKETKQYILTLFSNLMENEENREMLNAIRIGRSIQNGTTDMSFYLKEGKEDEGFSKVLKIMQLIKNKEITDKSELIEQMYKTADGINGENVNLISIEYDGQRLNYNVEIDDEEDPNFTYRIEGLEHKEIIGWCKAIQNNPELYNGDRRSILDNIFQYCKDQKNITLTYLKCIQWAKKRDEMSRNEVEGKDKENESYE